MVLPDDFGWISFESGAILPGDLGKVVFAEELIGAGKMVVAKEAVVSGEGRGVGTFEHEVLFAIDKASFTTGIPAPEKEDEVGASFV